MITKLSICHNLSMIPVVITKLSICHNLSKIPVVITKLSICHNLSNLDSLHADINDTSCLAFHTTSGLVLWRLINKNNTVEVVK